MTIQSAPVMQTQMLIRRPVSEVFNALVDPNVTSRFWFTRSSGRMEQGTQILWEWEMYGASAQVKVKAVQRDSRIVIEWGEPPRTVEWTFAPREDRSTLVGITEQGFAGNDDEKVAQALDSMGGFTMVLASLKALLEHDVVLNLVGDRHPDAHQGNGQ